MAKDSHILSTKSNSMCKIHVRNFDKSLINNVVNFEQLGPGVCDRLAAASWVCKPVI